MDGIAGKVYVVTGGYGGIARATADYLLRLGGRVVLTGRDKAKGKAALDELTHAVTGADVRFIPMDVADSASVNDAVEQVVSEMGAIQGAVVNAAIARFGSSLQITDEEWRSVLATNLDGSFYCARAFGRSMREKGGSIVFISSIASRISGYPAQFVHYGASKAGVSHLAQMLAVEWADEGIRVNVVEPGYTETQAIEHLKRDAPAAAAKMLENIPMHRFIAPKEIAQVVAFLLSDSSSAMTGSVIIADAGVTAR